MKKLRRLFSVFAGCFTFFLIGTAFAVRADEKDDLEKQRIAELKKIDTIIKAQVIALIAAEADPNDAKSLYELGVRDVWTSDVRLSPEHGHEASAQARRTVKHAVGIPEPLKTGGADFSGGTVRRSRRRVRNIPCRSRGDHRRTADRLIRGDE